jgi:hypothetical protein
MQQVQVMQSNAGQSAQATLSTATSTVQALQGSAVVSATTQVNFLKA